MEILALRLRDIKQAASLFSRSFRPLSVSSSVATVSTGRTVISVKRKPPCSFSILPSAVTSSATLSNFEYSEIERKVEMKQDATAARKKVSGDHISASPPNSGGVANSIACGTDSPETIPRLARIQYAVVRKL